LIDRFFVNKHNDIFLKCDATFSDRYGMEDLNIAKQLGSVLCCIAEGSTVSAVCDIKDDPNDQLAQQDPAISGK